MNPITYSIERTIEYDIPRAMLEMCFLSRLKHDRISLLTLESQIRRIVFEKRVLVDCNLQHGTMMHIPVADCTLLENDFYSSTYHVPMNLTQYKRITSPLHVTNTNGAVMPNNGEGYSGGAGMGSSSMSSFSSSYGNGNRSHSIMTSTIQVAQSTAPIPDVSNALTYLVGDNTILVKGASVVPGNMYFRVMVENDSNFNHILPQWYTTFHELALEAVKSYMYNNLVLEQDNVFIHSGGELNKFRDILESYSDSSELYKELLMSWTKSALLNDPEGSRRHYQSVVPGGL